MQLAPPTVDQRVDTCMKHLEFSLQWKGERLGVVEMRRHYASYFKGFDNFKPFRMQLVTEESPEVLKSILNEVRAYYNSTQLVEI